MHEYAVTKNVIETVLEEAQNNEASKVLSITLVIGDLSTVVDDSITMYFEIFSQNTLAQGAALIFKRIPAEFYCKSCQENFQKPKKGFECPKCGQTGQLTDKGREFYIESIEIE